MATLLAEAAMTNPSMRRPLQFELSAQKHDNVPEVIRRQICELREQTSFFGAEQADELARELDDMRATIVSNVSRAAPKLAPDLMWQLWCRKILTVTRYSGDVLTNRLLCAAAGSASRPLPMSRALQSSFGCRVSSDSR